MSDIDFLISKFEYSLIDWDDCSLPDGAEPRDIPTCGDIRALLSALKAERERADRAEAEVASLREYVDEDKADADKWRRLACIDGPANSFELWKDRAEAAEKACEEYRQYAAEKSNQYIASEARLKRAEELLKPFAAQGIHAAVSDARRLSYPLSHTTVGDIRAAARFLESKDAVR